MHADEAGGAGEEDGHGDYPVFRTRGPRLV
jgi:hypothetical protein